LAAAAKREKEKTAKILKSDIEAIRETDQELYESESDLEMKTFTNASLLKGKIIVAEDQLVNIEIIQGYLKKLSVEELSIVCVNGQIAIDQCKGLIDKAIYENDSLDNVVCPISLCLLDF
jgi:hypothetical protein